MEQNTGRYWYRTKSGRTFLIEPQHERNQKDTDRVFTNGGFDGTAVKNKSLSLGGSVSPDESVITPENGFAYSVTLPAGHSPESYCDMLERTGKHPGE